MPLCPTATTAAASLPNLSELSASWMAVTHMLFGHTIPVVSMFMCKRLNASATTLSVPLMYLIVKSYCCKNLSHRACFLDSMGCVCRKIKGWWSVSSVNLFPSRKHLYSLMASTCATTSFSPTVQLVSAPLSFLEKNATGYLPLLVSCCKTAPTAKSEASLVTRNSLS